MEKRLIYLILALFCVAGSLYATLTPPFEMSDELWHYPMVQHLSNGNRLPVQVFDPNEAGPWKQEASQPPLYYYLGAALTFWIDTSDMPTARQLNPHVSNGEITADGNINLAVHNNRSLSPWQGTLLAVRIVRLFSVLLGAATVYLTWLLGREVVPGRPDVRLLAAILVGFTPMFLFISGAVNNDNLAIPLASLGLLLLIRAVKQREVLIRVVSGEAQSKLGRFLVTNSGSLLVIGSVIGLAVLTKQGTIGLLPLAWGTFFILGWLQIRSRFLAPNLTFVKGGGLLLQALGRSLLSFGLMFLPVLLIAGWWYYRNIRLYGDLLGWSAFEAVLGVRETPASIAQLWDERWGFMLSYWGLFGGVNVPMSTAVYYVLNGLLLLGLAGGLFYGWQVLRSFSFLDDEREKERRAAPFWAQRLIVFVLDGVVRYFGLVVCLLFSVAIVYGLVQWARNTWSSQGRLVFTAISALNILFALGLIGWLRPSKTTHRLAAVIGFGLISLGLLAPFLYIRPAYDPSRVGDIDLSGLPAQTHDGAVFTDYLQLVESRYEAVPLQPGDHFDVELTWRTVSTSDRNWSVFIQLVDPVIGKPIAQRDMYLGQGLLASAYLEEGVEIVNRYRLEIPQTAVTPAELALHVGIYDFNDPFQERLLLPDGESFIELDRLALAPLNGDFPNPVAVNFEDRFELVGFDIDPRRARPGDQIEATFYWRALAPSEIDFTFYAQLVDPSTKLWGQLDLPQGTAGWPVGEIQTLTYPLQLDPETPTGTYPLRLGIYTRNADGSFRNLQRVTSDGRLTDDFINLTDIRVD